MGQQVKVFIERWESSGAAMRAAHTSPATAEQLDRTFTRAPAKRVADLLETLATLDQARQLDDGRYSTN